MIRFLEPGGRIYSNVGSSYVNLLSYWDGYDSIGSSYSMSVNTGGGRYTGSCLRFATANYTSTVSAYKVLDSQTTWGIAFALRFNIIPITTYVPIVSLENAGSGQINICLNIDGTLSVTRGNANGGTSLGSTSQALVVNRWYHIELKVFMNASTGTVELRINGTAKLGPLTSQNTASSANALRIGFIVNPTNNATNLSGWNLDFDDLILWDGQTTDANGLTDVSNFVGDCGVYWSLPTAAGTTTQFTPDSGSNYARVNEDTPDSTSYVESNVLGQIDTYAMADLPATITTVKNVGVVSYSRKTDVGSRQQITSIRAGGTNYFHTTAIDLADAYTYNLRTWGRNPDTSSTWTTSDVNSLEAGQKVGS